MQQFDQIYSSASDEFKKATPEQEGIRFLTAVSGKLGAVKTTEDSGWKIDFRPSGTVVTLAFKTQFERGTGVETFIYRMTDGRPLLAGYNVNSTALITN